MSSDQETTPMLNDNQQESAARIVDPGAFSPSPMARAQEARRDAAFAKAADIHALYASRIEVLTEALRGLERAVVSHGDWDDDCFYYAGRSASELQEPLRKAHAALRTVSQ